MEQKMINGVYCQNMPCCGIFAAALASGKEPQEVFDAYKAKFKKTGRWKGSTTTKGLKELMRNQLGVKFVEIPDLKWMTVRQFAVNYTKRSGTYLVWVRGHVMTISKGRLIDQWHCQPIETAKKNRCKIVSVVEIVNAPDIPEGQISGNATKEQLAEAQQKRDAEKLEADKAKLWKGCCKFGLDSKKIGEFEGDKFKLVGYNPRKTRYPFTVEMILRKGKECSTLASCSAYTARKLFAVQEPQFQAA